MSTDLGIQQTPQPETRADSVRVEPDYKLLDADGTKKEFDALNDVLDGLAQIAIHTLGEMVPYLAKMQSLLSQRGSDRKKVLRKAGIPGWTEWVKTYAVKLDCSIRTVQDRIRQFHEGRESGTAAPSTKAKRARNGERVRLDGRQQAALVKAQLAANDLVAALENDGDWQTALATYRKVAVSPEKLDSFVNALNPEPDWKGILAQLANTLEQCGDRLPIPAKNALRTVQKLLDGKPNQQQLPSGKPKAADTKQNSVQKDRKDASTCCAVQPGEMPSGNDPKPPASVKATERPPVRDPEKECEHGTLDAASVQGSPPLAEGRGSTPPKKTSAERRLRKAKAQREYYARTKQGQPAARASTPAATQPAAASTLKQGISEEARCKLSVAAPKSPSDGAAMPTSEAGSNQPARRRGDFVRNEEGRWEYDPEEQQVREVEKTRNAQPGQSLNKSPVANIVPQHTNPKSAAQSAAS